MRLLEASGAPYEIGQQVGAQAIDLVQRAVELICRFDLPESERLERLDGIERRLRRSFPDVLEEAEGLAEAVGMSRQQVLELSVCSDLTGKLPAWCSLAAVPGTSGTLVAKNLDTTPEMGPIQVLERIEPDRGVPYLHMTTAGAMWTDGGVNAAGLALANASLAAALPNPDGVPDGILARAILTRCTDVAEAVELASTHPVRTLGENLLVADANGRVAVIEKLPHGQAVREGETTAACNHVLSPELESEMDPADTIRANSRRRLAALERLLAANEAWTHEQLGQIMTAPDGDVFQDGEDELWTLASLVFDPAGRRLWITEAGTESSALTEVNLNGNGGRATKVHEEEEAHHVDTPR